ncbi:hypothetical protein [Streptomyces sp. JW3]|uniref:hypothetical protein n=1 Tax=Streptomyces sp. JW3 TaxID=3456955 RepID=UPI003FA4C4C9
MTRRTAAHPDLTRPDATAPFFSTGRVGTPERQRRRGGLEREAGDSRVPGFVTTVTTTHTDRIEREPGMISGHIYLSTAGTHVRTCAEWEDGAPVPRGPGVSRYAHALGLVPG